MGFHISNGVLEKYTEEEGVTEAVIPYKVKAIGGEAFYGCTNLKSVTIPRSVKTIGCCAFADCSNLKSITIPDSVTSIDDCAFYGCSNLTSVSIPDSVTSISGMQSRVKVIQINMAALPTHC